MTDQWRCRFISDGSADNGSIVALLGRLNEAGAEFGMTEHLYSFDGERGYTLSQGE